MRLARFDGGRIGAVRDDSITDITELVDATAPDTAGAGIVTVLGLTPPELAALTDAAAALEARPLDSVRLECPLPAPSKIPSIPSNYRKHIAEMGSVLTVAERGVFLKAPSSVIGHGEVIKLPYHDRRTDHESELGVVIGRRAAHVTAADALSYVGGYTCLLDITVRGKEERSMRKSHDTFTPIGPWITTADEIADPDDLAIACWVNGETRQEARTSSMIWSVPRLIELVSSVMTLQPGDVIATGTPEGVGPIVDGDELSMEIEGIGRLTVTVSADGATTCPFRGQ